MKNKTFLFLIFLTVAIAIPSLVAENLIVIDYYYSPNCPTCRVYTEEVIDPIEENFSGKVIVNRVDVKANNDNWKEFVNHGFGSYPAAVVNNVTKIPKSNLTYETLEEIILAYIAEAEYNQTFNEFEIEIPIIGTINTTSLSLPILTVVLGSLDSLNPCSFFILIFLLNLLLHVQSRRKMLLVGGIFIFFSGFFYFLFMFILYSSLVITSQYIDIISIIAGIIAIIIGIFNVKDFFFFKKGLSLSIPKDKQHEIFKKMRDLIKTTYFPAIIGGAIFLAIIVNFYELICTLGFPIIYTTRLTYENLPIFEYSAYILFYNVVYVIPLLVILFIFVYTLGRRKLTELQGRKLKLLSGIMIFSFGLFFIVDYQLLETFFTPILLLISSIFFTMVISFIWDKYKKKKEDSES